MKLQIRYFASVREALGASEVVDVPQGSTLSQLRDLLVQRSPAHARALARGGALRCALNQQLSDETAVVSEGAEVAFFPPITGG